MPRKKAPSVFNDDPSMRGQRARNEDGELRRKRGDTRVDTIEQMYDVDFGVRGDMQFGRDSIDKLIERVRAK